MKKISIFFIASIALLATELKAQALDPVPDSLVVEPTKAVITVGLLHGGSIAGADIEFRMLDGIGFQVGAGLIGFSTALNFHFKTDIKSSCISMAYIHQGFGKLYFESLFVPSYIHRWKGGLSTQIGVGFLAEFGPKAKDLFKNEVPTLQPYLAVGYYF